MTVEEKLREMLIADGMPTEQANQVIKRTKKHEAAEAMTGRWNHNLEDYPPSVVLILHLTAQEVASDAPPAA